MVRLVGRQHRALKPFPQGLKRGGSVGLDVLSHKVEKQHHLAIQLVCRRIERVAARTAILVVLVVGFRVRATVSAVGCAIGVHGSGSVKVRVDVKHGVVVVVVVPVPAAVPVTDTLAVAARPHPALALPCIRLVTHRHVQLDQLLHGHANNLFAKHGQVFIAHKQEHVLQKMLLHFVRLSLVRPLLAHRRRNHPHLRRRHVNHPCQRRQCMPRHQPPLCPSHHRISRRVHRIVPAIATAALVAWARAGACWASNWCRGHGNKLSDYRVDARLAIHAVGRHQRHEKGTQVLKHCFRESLPRYVQDDVDDLSGTAVQTRHAVQQRFHPSAQFRHPCVGAILCAIAWVGGFTKLTNNCHVLRSVLAAVFDAFANNLPGSHGTTAGSVAGPFIRRPSRHADKERRWRCNQE
eukprot:m.83895 g.83895  ORF g.83895 m.83895 type:complete len:407 (+) comp14778_c0_seq6:1387-2607(+)